MTDEEKRAKPRVWSKRDPDWPPPLGHVQRLSPLYRNPAPNLIYRALGKGEAPSEDTMLPTTPDAVMTRMLMEARAQVPAGVLISGGEKTMQGSDGVYVWGYAVFYCKPVMEGG